MRKNTGFDYLRLILAVSVLCSHSAFVAPTAGANSVSVWEGPYRAISSLMLPMFFSLSGYLVAGSLFRTPGILQFLTLRALRIVPALFVEVVLSALILGPLVTTLTLRQYFSSAVFYQYWLNIVGLIRYELPGVFEHNPLANVVNVSLWTIPYELECYIAISVLAVTTMIYRRRPMVVLFAIFTITVPLWQAMTTGFEWTRPSGKVLVLCFLAGNLLYIFRDSIRMNLAHFILSVFLALIFLSTPYSAFLAALPVTYMTVYLGLLNIPKLPVLMDGDYSYGLYLYAFPMQQLHAWLNVPPLLWWTNILVALPLALIWAMLSWHLVEKRVLAKRNNALNFVRRFQFRSSAIMAPAPIE